jgi:hypothetical protein
VRKQTWLASILLLSLFFTSCQKNARPPAAAPAASAGGEPTEQGQAANPPRPPAHALPRPPEQPQIGAGKTITLSPENRKQSTAAAPRPLASVSTLMALDRDKHALPEDFKIGPLGDSREEKADEAGAMAAAEAFLAHLVAGRIDRTLLTPDSEKAVSDTLAYGLQQGFTPASYRLGLPKKHDNGEVAANVRLFGADGTSEGEIYMAMAGTQWLVSDLQLSLAALAVTREKSKEKFFPSAYRWLLED